MKKIKLTQNKFVIVDDKDFEWLNQWKWSMGKNYARRATPNDAVFKFHGEFGRLA